MDTPEQMFEYEYVDPSCVTGDMGGQLEFDANEWTQNRSVSYSSFNSNELVLCDGLLTVVKWDTSVTHFPYKYKS